MNRNWKILWVGVYDMFGLLNWFGKDCISLPVFTIPGGDKCEVVDVLYCWERRQFGIRLAHPSFPDVPEMEVTPSAHPGEIEMIVLHMNYALDSVPNHIVVDCPLPKPERASIDTSPTPG